MEKFSPAKPRSGRRGRKLGFDRQIALQRALALFWERGYEGTSVADLVSAMGITPPSLYTAFGDKASLYREAIGLYLAEWGAFMSRALDEEPTARAAFERILTEAASAFSVAASNHQPGCLVSSALIGCSPSTRPLADELCQMRERSRAAFVARLERARAEGELSPATDIEGLASFLAATVQGMSVQAWDGAGPDRLSAIARFSLKVFLDGCSTSEG